MHVAFFEVKDWERAYLSDRLPADQLSFASESLSAPTKQWKELEALSVFIYSHVTREVLDALPALKFIATRSTGFDHIDVQACRGRGIAVSNVPSYGENTVAEHTIALLLMLSRKVHQSVLQMRSGRVDLAELTGFDLQGKTIGVVGSGHIGLHVIRIARGFGMRVLGYDVRRDPFLADLLGFEYATMERLLEESDIVTLHSPLTEQTHHLLSRAEFARMKPGVMIVNTARGGLIDTDALVEALESGKVGGAGLDVLEGEELIKEEKQLLQQPLDVEKLRTAVRNRVLLARDNVVFTPHNAFNSREALVRILEVTLSNLEAFRAGQPVHRVA
ncbi:MAG TPA: hydroxyacid dehydrogenase [Candidatus Acidoferrales bacterium]|jgi:D-lactate dehydrogenase|nr:hydroxyacid dehydrogenase [Candidatus Acidoferrales bacterium]